jgi:hypothetical protein
MNIIPLYRVVKFIDSRQLFPGNVELVFSNYKVSVWEDERVLGIDGTEVVMVVIH